MTRLNCRRKLTAPGFTIVELMIVIAIVALLAGISFGVIAGMLANAKETATRATIAKVDGMLKSQISGFYKQLDPRSQETQTLAGKFRSPPYRLTPDRDTSIVLATKAAFLRLYPQNLYEAAGFDRLPETRDDIPLFFEWLKDHHPGSSVHNPNANSAADSSELLYLAVTEGKVVGGPANADGDLTAAETGDTDGDGWTEILDAWGNPLRFYRWPTRLVNPFGFIGSRHDGAGDPNGIAVTDTSIDLASGTGNSFSFLPTPFRVVIGREVIEIGSISGDTLNVTQRGAQSTDATSHPPGSKVKLAPFTNLATLLLGFVNSDLLAKDPDDKFGSILELNQAGNLAHIRALGDPPFANDAITDFELLFHTLDSYHAPLIVSAGADEQLGLVEPGPISLAGTSPDPSDPRNPQNIWIPGSSLNGSGPPADPWQWGTLAQPLMPPDPSTPSGRDLSILRNPGSSVLQDNITNYNGSN